MRNLLERSKVLLSGFWKKRYYNISKKENYFYFEVPSRFEEFEKYLFQKLYNRLFILAVGVNIIICIWLIKYDYF